jgi:hypothetical protein
LKRDSDYLQFRPYKAIVASPTKGRLSPISAGRSTLPGFSVRRASGGPVRSRLLYAGLIVAVIGIGLLWRSSLISLPPFLAKYGGSAWWSIMVFLLCGFVASRARTIAVTLAALAIAAGVEFFQLYHAPWIDSIRSYQLGGLALGSVFAWQDIVAYTIGILIGAVVEKVLRSDTVNGRR